MAIPSYSRPGRPALFDDDTRGLLRELAALVLLVVGVLGLVIVGFWVSIKVGAAVVSVLFILAGLALGYERRREVR